MGKEQRKKEKNNHFFNLSLLKDKQHTLLDYSIWMCTYLCISIFYVHTCLGICTYICNGICAYVCLRTTSGFWMKTKTLPINPTCSPDYISLENIPETTFCGRNKSKPPGLESEVKDSWGRYPPLISNIYTYTVYISACLSTHMYLCMWHRIHRDMTFFILDSLMQNKCPLDCLSHCLATKSFRKLHIFCQYSSRKWNSQGWPPPLEEPQTSD